MSSSFLFRSQRGDWPRARGLLEGYREEGMAVLPALAQESYVRAYPHLVRLHMMQVRERGQGGRRGPLAGDSC